MAAESDFSNWFLGNMKVISAKLYPGNFGKWKIHPSASVLHGYIGLINQQWIGYQQAQNCLRWNTKYLTKLTMVDGLIWNKIQNAAYETQNEECENAR